MILITGAGGFLGSHLTRLLTELGYDLIPMYHGNEIIIRADYWQGDLTCPEHINYLKRMDQRPDTVIHLAARVEISLRANPEDNTRNPIPGVEDIYRIYLTNLIGTAHILDYCLFKGVRHVIFASSQTVYGIPIVRKVNEVTETNPLEHYGVSKVACEKMLKVGAGQGLKVTALRLPGLYGESRTNGVVFNFLKNAIEKRRIVVTTDIPIPLDVIHVDDAAAAFERALSFQGSGWTCLNISSGEPCSLDILADSIARLVQGCVVEHDAVPQPVIQVDASLAESLLGWKPVPSEDRLRAMAEYMRNTK